MDQPLGWEYTKEGWSTDLPFESIPGHLIMAVMTGHGDLKQVWNTANADEVEAAKAVFDKMVGEKRYLCFRVGDDGKPGEQIDEFDADAGKMILVPQVAGG